MKSVISIQAQERHHRFSGPSARVQISLFEQNDLGQWVSQIQFHIPGPGYHIAPSRLTACDSR
ncbi:MAG: hypothetical protein AAGA10_24785, partial [Bacteroidota bacterium]